MQTIHPIQLPNHALEHLRTLQPGEELLVVLPVKPPLTFVEPAICQFGDGHSGVGWYFANEDYPEEGSLFRECPYVPGDVLVMREPVHQSVSYNGILKDDGMVEHRLPITRVECKQARGLTEGEWRAAGFTPGPFACDVVFNAADMAEVNWGVTYAHLGPEYAWERVWVWCVWITKGR